MSASGSMLVRQTVVACNNAEVISYGQEVGSWFLLHG